VCIASGVLAQDLKPVLTAASAKTIVSGCEAYARETGIDIAIAVTGPGDILVAFARTDGAVPGAGEVAIWKAKSSSNFGLSSKQLAEIAIESPGVAAIPLVAPVEGGEAIYTRDGLLIGGVGVSGARAEEDAACARAGITKAKLKFQKREE